ncbi:hypothetical protein HAV15_000708 [Penicillium sp. str. |nr:hypothetical protein HAV15_000708 [Penicillium sp. str. \
MPSIFGKKTKPPVPTMLDGGNFKPVKDYAKYYNKYAIKCQEVKYDRSIFVDVIVADMTLRGLVQHCESVKKKLELPVFTPEDKSKVQKWEEELHHLQEAISFQQHRLYECATFLPRQPLKQMYDSVRENPAWYCHPEIVEDCAKRGGCCGRSCGYCQTRHLTTLRAKGIVHCTIGCSCCSEHRGADPSPEERTGVNKMIESMLLSSNPTYLMKMIEAYFSKLAYLTEVTRPKKE